jgi:hypothetical protein
MLSLSDDADSWWVDEWSPHLYDDGAVGFANYLGLELPRMVAKNLSDQLWVKLPLKGLISAQQAQQAAAKLSESVNLSGVVMGVDLFHCPVLRAALRPHGLNLGAPQVVSFVDGLRPARMQELANRCPPDVVIGLCPGDLADLAVPFALRYVAGFVAMLVPYAYFADAEAARMEQLQCYKDQRVLHLCPVPDEEPGTVRYVWLVVFDCEGAVMRLLRPNMALMPDLKMPVL